MIEQSAQALAMTQQEAAFAASVVTVLQAAQSTALKAACDNDEIVRMIQSLAGRSGGPGGDPAGSIELSRGLHEEIRQWARPGARPPSITRSSGPFHQPQQQPQWQCRLPLLACLEWDGRQR